jgi:hypothetical protein
MKSHRLTTILSALSIAAVFAFTAITENANSFIFPGGAPAGGGGGGGALFAIRVYNPTGGSVSNIPQQYKQPFQQGDLPTGTHLEMRKSDQTTVVASQQDGCSTWAQDGSCQAVTVNFTEPDTISSGGAYATYYGFAVSGAPNNTPAVTTANITANTNFCYKTSDLFQASGTAETGTWDLLCLNNVLTNLTQYNGSTGYGSNPVGGWEYTAQGPNVTSIHAFMYAKRVSDNAIHKWIRTDAWFEFRGSGSTPCPCKMQAVVSQPNTYGPLSGGTVGQATETGYYFSATLQNGATVMYSWGGSADARNITTLTSSNFNTTTEIMTLPGGNAWEKTGGVFPVKFASTGTCPTGLTCGTTYWIWMQGATNNLANADQSQLWTNECAPTSGNCTNTPIDLTSAGTGTITITPLIPLNPFGGAAFLDSTAQPIYTDSAGAVTTAPVTLIAQDFNYLTQKTKAVMPYITANWLNMQTLASAYTYYPGTYLWPADINQTGDGIGDERIGFIPHSPANALHQPNSPTWAQQSRVFAAAWSRAHMYHMDEVSGQPVVLNNGHAKNGVTYATLGVVNPGYRSYPYNTGTWLTPSTNNVDKDMFQERYGVWIDGSHLPVPQQEIFLRSGDPMWQFSMIQEALATKANYYWTNFPVNSVNYYRPTGVNGQTRGVAWSGNVMDQVDYFEPETSPLALYFHDLEQDDADWAYQWHNTQAPAHMSALGYFMLDTAVGFAGNYFQNWQTDFVFMRFARQTWRGEYANFGNFTVGYLSKYVVGRMDSSVGGCLWAGPSRFMSPYTNNSQSDANLPTSFNTAWSNTNLNRELGANVQASIAGTVMTVTSVNYNGAQIQVSTGQTVYAGGVSKGVIVPGGTGTGGIGTYNLNTSNTVSATTIDTAIADQGWALPPYWTTCPSSGFWDDAGASSDANPTGVANFAVVALGMGAVVGVTNASSLYSTGRARTITDGYTCTAYPMGGGTFVSAPEFCFGPLGATQ